MKAATAQIELVAPRDQLAFLDQQSVVLDAPVTPLEAWQRMTARPLPPLRWAFRIRDAVSALFGVRRIGGLSGQTPAQVGPGDRLDFFTVERISDARLTLSARDRHLDTFTCITSHDRVLTVTSSVKVHNLFGHIYMLPVRPAHRMIVRAMLRRLRREMDQFSSS